MSGGGFALSHSGRQHAYRVAQALQEARCLDVFFTSSFYKPHQWPDRIARAVPRLDRWLRKRWQEGIDASRVRRDPLVELPEMLARFTGAAPERVGSLVQSRDMRFDRWVSRKLAAAGSRAFWGFQGSCFESLGAAREAGMVSVVELASIPSQVIRQLQGREAGVAMADERGATEYSARLDGEPGRADWCIAASRFTASSLAAIGIPSDRIKVIPLGVDVRKFRHGKRTTSGPLRVLFVGKLATHKGLRYLLEAMKAVRWGGVTLSLAGPDVTGGEGERLDLGMDGVRRLGTVEDIERVYSEHDVLVLPSLYEGFGLVILEAMASGMPVIATANSCGPDVITEGVDGFVVPAFDSGAIALRLEWFATNRRLIPEMGRLASARAAEFTWDRHAARVAQFTREVLVPAS